MRKLAVLLLACVLVLGFSGCPDDNIQVLYSITYHANGGSGTAPAAETHAEGATVTVAAKGDVSKAGHVFKDWNTAADGNGTSYNPADTFTMPASNLVLYAQWEATGTYSVTFNAQGGSGSPPDNQQHTFGETVVVPGPGSLTKAGYWLDGWYVTYGEVFELHRPDESFTMPAANVVLVANWAADFLLSYHTNDGSWSGAPHAQETHAPGESVTVKDCDNLYREHYDCTGWNTAADGNGTSYDPGDELAMPEHDLTLYAEWEQWPKAIFDANGATGTAPDSQWAKTGDDVTIPGPGDLTKTGFVFDGWSTDATGQTEYEPGETLALDAQDVVLYAIWRLPKDLVMIAAGYDHTMVLAEDGTLWGSGRNQSGSLGLGHDTERRTMVKIADDVDGVWAGRHYTIIKKDGKLWGVGENQNGQLGVGDAINKYQWTEVGGNFASDVVDVACGYYHTLFMTSTGVLYATGLNNWGQLLDSTTNNRVLPVEVATGVAAVETGSTHSFYRKGSDLYAVGYNINYGQLGDGTLTNIDVPTIVRSDAAAFSSTHYHTVFTTTDNKIFSMGYNAQGQLGLGDAESPVLVPEQVEILEFMPKSVATGEHYSMVVGQDGSLYAMGYGGDGQFGNGEQTTSSVPVKVVEIGVDTIECGADFTVVLKTDKSVWVSGDNYYGQCGLGATLAEVSFTRVIL